MKRVLLFLAAIGVVALSVHADTVVLRNGGVLDGVVLSQSDTEVRIRTDAVTASFKMTDVTSVTIVPRTDKAISARVANWQTALGIFAEKAYGGEVHQIPATVIDKGVMKRVPYMSNRSGDYEMNIYGDPDNPAGIEIGVYGVLVADAKAQLNCREFIKSILGHGADKKLVDALKADIDSKDVDGWTFEVTPPTAEDAYGGWWISVYSTKALDDSRASEAELAAITVKKAEAAAVNKKAAQDAGAMNTASKTASPADGHSWSSDEIKLARATKDTSSSYGGSVYVRGYMRKNGTYVQSYTRSAPRSRR
jgi:hypothetical protein